MWGSPDITTGLYIWKSIIPSFLGNAVGALLVGIPYRYLFIDDLSVFGNTNTDGRHEDLESSSTRQTKHEEDEDEKVHPHHQLQLGTRIAMLAGGRTPNRSRPESTLAGGRTPSVKSGHEAEGK